MKTETLMDCIGQIDDGIITEADNSIAKIFPVKRPWIKWASLAAAAAACVIIAIPFILDLRQPAGSGDYSDLPKLSVNSGFQSFGFEGFLAFDINELFSNNPWTADNGLSTMPVYTNPAQYDTAGKPVGGLSADEMIAKAKETASVMGLTADSVYTEPTDEALQRQEEKERSIPGNEGYKADITPEWAIAVCGDVIIRVSPNGEVSVEFTKGVPLPDGYSFINYDNTEEQAKDSLLYLLEQYASVAAMQSPAPALFGDYTYAAQRLFDYRAYDNSGSLTERILGYNFNTVTFAPNDDGDLMLIRRSSPETMLSQKIADYPIITADEARALLLGKRYITTVPEEMPGADYIARAELVYRAGRYDAVFMPYYRFLVELPAMQRDNGLKTFGAFYVPAVKGEFLSEMPLWDGSFN